MNTDKFMERPLVRRAWQICQRSGCLQPELALDMILSKVDTIMSITERRRSSAFAPHGADDEPEPSPENHHADIRSFHTPWVRLPLLFLAPLLVTGASADDEKPLAVVKAADARNHIDERCTVELTVRSSKNAAPRREYYLDSEEDFHDEKNFAVVISYDHADLFKKAGIDDAAEHYKGKSLRVTGKVIHENDQVRIRVEDPKQIKIVEAGK